MAHADACGSAVWFVADTHCDFLLLCVAKCVSPNSNGGTVCIPAYFTPALVSVCIFRFQFPNHYIIQYNVYIMTV